MLCRAGESQPPDSRWTSLSALAGLLPLNPTRPKAPLMRSSAALLRAGPGPDLRVEHSQQQAPSTPPRSWRGGCTEPLSELLGVWETNPRRPLGAFQEAIRSTRPPPALNLLGRSLSVLETRRGVCQESVEAEPKGLSLKQRLQGPGPPGRQRPGFLRAQQPAARSCHPHPLENPRNACVCTAGSGRSPLRWGPWEGDCPAALHPKAGSWPGSPGLDKEAPEPTTRGHAGNTARGLVSVCVHLCACLRFCVYMPVWWCVCLCVFVCMCPLGVCVDLYPCADL